MPDEIPPTQSIETPVVSTGVMDTPIVIEPAAVASEAPQAVDEPAVAVPAATPTAAPEKSFEEKLSDYMHGRSDVDPTETAAPKAKATVSEEAAVDPEPEPAPVPVAKPVVTQSQPKARDFTGLTQDEVAIFQKMSNAAYDKLRPVYDSHKKIAEREAQLKAREESVSNALPKGVFDHEQAYTLAPQFNQLASTVQKLEFERGYWAKQFASVENGEDYKPLMIDKEGRYVEGKPQRATPEAKAEIMNNMTLATQLHSQHQQQLQQVQQTFTNRRAELVRGIQTYEKNLFGFLDAPDNPYKPVIKEVMAAIPEEFRDHPLASWVAKSMATIKAQADLNAKLTKAAASRQVSQADARKAGPTLTRTNTSTSGTRPVASEPDYSKMSPADIIASFKQA